MYMYTILEPGLENVNPPWLTPHPRITDPAKERNRKQVLLPKPPTVTARRENESTMKTLATFCMVGCLPIIDYAASLKTLQSSPTFLWVFTAAHLVFSRPVGNFHA